MADAVRSTAVPSAAEEDPPASYRAALRLLASLFFMWGFITVINNTLLPHLRSVFDLNYTQTTLIESVWFIAYFVASIPSAKLIERIGYQRSLVDRLAIMAAGALGMMPAARIPVLRRHAGRAVRDRERDHAAAGRGQPLCRGGRPTGDRLVAAQSRPGVQLAGHDARAAVRRLSDPRALAIGDDQGRAAFGPRPSGWRTRSRCSCPM